MNMTPPEIAKSLLDRRNRMNPIVLPGEIRSAIGVEGVAEALKRRWLLPDLEDSGFLRVTNDLGVIESMRQLAQVKPEQYTPEALPVAESHDLAVLHTRRRHVLSEVAAPATGKPAPGLISIAMPNPASGQPPEPYAVGVPVTVARQGVKANGVIEKRMPDGRFQVGFAPDQQKPQGDSVYSQEELGLVPQNPQRTPVPVTAVR
jgi:hypothetical protein